MQKRWDISNQLAEILAQFPEIWRCQCSCYGSVTCHQEAIDQFCYQTTPDLHDFFLICDEPASEFEALLNGERIVVHGDYDADAWPVQLCYLDLREIGRAWKLMLIKSLVTFRIVKEGWCAQWDHRKLRRYYI